MTQTVWNPDWLDSNSIRSYPMMDGDSHTDASGTFTIPHDLILDAAIPVEYSDSLDITNIYISSIIASTAQIIITVSQGTTPLFEFIYSSANGDRYTVTAKQLKGNFIGRMTFGKDPLATISSGHFTFDSTATKLVPHCIQVLPQLVHSVYFVNNGIESEKITGNIALTGGGAIIISRYQNNINISCQARVDPATGEEDEDNCDPLAQLGIPAGAIPIRSISGVMPDESGNINIVQLEGVQITVSDDSISISNPNAEPCCTNEEVSSVVQSVITLETQAAALEQTSQAVNEKYDEMNAVINASDI